MAIVQRDAKRMLAYSSISHAGFILVGVQAASDAGTAAVVFYAVAYTFLVIGSFGVLVRRVRRGRPRRPALDDLDGLVVSDGPRLALALTIFLLAQAGVPFTSGFVAKFEVIGAAVDGPVVLARHRRHGHRRRVGVPVPAHRVVDVPRARRPTDALRRFVVPRAAAAAIVDRR